MSPPPGTKGCLFSLLGEHVVILSSSGRAQQLQYVLEARADGWGGWSHVLPVVPSSFPHGPNSEISNEHFRESCDAWPARLEIGIRRLLSHNQLLPKFMFTPTAGELTTNGL